MSCPPWLVTLLCFICFKNFQLWRGVVFYTHLQKKTLLSSVFHNIYQRNNQFPKRIIIISISKMRSTPYLGNELTASVSAWRPCFLHLHVCLSSEISPNQRHQVALYCQIGKDCVINIILYN